MPAYVAVPIAQLQAEEIGRYPAIEAGQGAAADSDHVYAIVNTAIGQYRKADGTFVRRWASPRTGLVRHINSCYAEEGRLYCANSNFPEIPMASSIEVFDTATMTHIASYSLGMLDEGSLTWFERIPGGWMAGFAHYDEDGGLPHKNHNYASIIRYDQEWRKIGGWMIPDSAISRMQPHAASGGGLGPDGLLYLTGHDRPEMYVMALPAMGPKLIHIATIAIDVEGQAFAWDKSGSERVVYGISRPNREVRSFLLPEVEVPQGVRRFSELGGNPLLTD
ncbi:MAG: hypothetical protein R3F41_14690 [Gammaproteobacteria bacterium]|nr:hypothetical protein [Pseudomonadales bacterium]MCP5347225.1 hypothetical protein [Pseudomonadales bacterium]